MILISQCLIIVVLLGIAYQDIKELAVTWILFPVLGALLFITYASVEMYEVIFLSIGMNSLLVTIVLLILWAYARFKLKQAFVNQVFGLGDILFFYAMAIGFPTISFIILFVFAIFFSLLIHLFMSGSKENNHVPLAGFMSIFLILALIVDWVLPSISLYKY